VSVELILPKFNMDMDSAVLVRWLRDDGDRIEEGDPVAEVETDKVNMEVEATVGGILCGLRYQPGDVVPVTAPMATLAADETEAEKVRAATPPPAPAAPTVDALPEPASTAASNGAAPATPVTPEQAAPLGGTRVRATPAIRRRAREAGIDLASLVGPGGRVTQAILQAAVAARSSGAATSAVSAGPAADADAPTPRAEGITRTPLDATRRAIAERMTRAGAVPQISLTVEARVSQLVRLRDGSVARPSFSAIFAVAAARAIRDHPILNSTFEDGVIVTRPGVDLGIAVARPAGLIVPVLRDADRLTVLEADPRIRELVTRAREGQLRLEEVSGGSFTITSLGEAGIDHFTPLLNPPQVAILAVGRIAQRVVPIENGIAVEPTVHLTLTCDHRVIDGAPGAEFLATLKRLLEAPSWLATSLQQA
jgi:pyruvate dehydrogenase E2 component (dihydrolipoamide acetyltransferase)